MATNNRKIHPILTQNPRHGTPVSYFKLQAGAAEEQEKISCAGNVACCSAARFLLPSGFGG